jgi:uncharacterized membrane protein HdeD (DUF308 family)
MTEPRSNTLKLSDNPAKRSLWTLSISAILIVVGVVCVLIPFVARIDGPPFIGRILVFCGCVHLFRLFSARARGTLEVLKRIPPVVIPLSIGILVLVNEGPHARSLSVLLMIFFVLDGYFKVISSIGTHPATIRGQPLISAGLSFFFAVFLAATFPGTPIWLLEVFLGLDLISMGIMNLSANSSSRARS